MADSFDDVIRQMVAVGMIPPEHLNIGAGRITRYGKKRTSWYIVHEHRLRDGKCVLVGAFGDWALQISQKIEVDWKGLGDAERETLRRQVIERERAEQEKRERQAHAAMNRARLQWKAAYTIQQAEERGIISPYLHGKQLTPENVRLADDGTLLIPAYVPGEVSGATMVGLQKILPTGEKKFNKGMAKQGASALLGKRPTDGAPIIVVEGYATGRSIRMAVPAFPVFCAFDAGNLLHVAKVLRREYPSSALLFCADDDWKTTLPDGTPFNPGLAKASEAAHAVGNAAVCVPLFPDAATREPKWTDFNDLHQACGLEALTAQLDVHGIIAAQASASIHEIDDLRKPRQGFGADADEEAAEFIGNSEAQKAFVPLEKPDGKEWWAADWLEKPFLQRTEKGALRSTLHNFEQFLTHHRKWADVLAFDEFAELPVKMAPILRDEPPADGRPQDWQQLDHDRLTGWLSTRGMEAGDKVLAKAINIVAHRRAYNGPKDYLESLKWDGVHRTLMWTFEYLGACTGPKFARMPLEEQDKVRRFCELAGQKWLIGAVRRVLNPGVKMDNMLILEGDQGRMKSTAFDVLGGEWYTDAKIDFDNKDTLMILQGRWIIELPEIESLNKASTSAAKHFLAQRVDLYRPPYGALLKKVPRRCVFGGTVNHDVYLKDETGNRRYWPIKCWQTVDLQGLREVRDQLWAEAVHLAREGVRHWVEGDVETELFAVEQEKRFQGDAWDEKVLTFCADREWVTTGQVMLGALEIEPGRWDKQSQQRVAAILRRDGWERDKLTSGPSRGNYFYKPDADGNNPRRKRGDDEAF